MGTPLRGNESPATPCIRFGRIALSEEVETFRHAMNRDIIALMKSLPDAVHGDALLFFMDTLAIPIIPQFDLFRNYFAPAWSIIYWTEKRLSPESNPSAEDRRNARTAHAMALFLHLLDDHLNDGQLPASHFNLLLRSQAWLRMQAALTGLSTQVADGQTIVREAANDYYGSIGSPPTTATFDGYCAHFRRQMATGLIAPSLLAGIMGGSDDFQHALRTAYGAFGIAWRLLDDWLDRVSDMHEGCRSAVYYGLPSEARALWDQGRRGPDPPQEQRIHQAIRLHNVGGTIRKRIRSELVSAIALLESIQMTGLADEIRCLAAPFTDGRGTP